MIRLYRNRSLMADDQVLIDIHTLKYDAFPWANWVCFDRDGTMYAVEKPHVPDRRTGRSCEVSFKLKGKHAPVGVVCFDTVDDWEKCFKLDGNQLTQTVYDPRI